MCRVRVLKARRIRFLVGRMALGTSVSGNVEVQHEAVWG